MRRGAFYHHTTKNWMHFKSQSDKTTNSELMALCSIAVLPNRRTIRPHFILKMPSSVSISVLSAALKMTREQPKLAPGYNTWHNAIIYRSKVIDHCKRRRKCTIIHLKIIQIRGMLPSNPFITVTYSFITLPTYLTQVNVQQITIFS